MKSVIVYTMHRSASMFLFKLTRKISHHFGMPYYSVNDHSFPDEHAYRKNPAVFSESQGCFCPIRFYVDVEGMEDYNIILHLRDPRDVLTSWYYSKAFSHPRRENEFTATDNDRAHWIKEGVDVNVLRDAHGVLLRYEEYCDNLLARPNVNFVKYEDMVLHFDKWLYSYISSFLPVDSGGESLGQKMRRQMFIKSLLLSQSLNLRLRKRKENINRHVRQVLPGDHKRKLKLDTIEELNDRFAHVLKRLDYDI